jgi:hypothetical protein
LARHLRGKARWANCWHKQLHLPQISLDDLRWDYFREIGYDDALAKELRQKGGFLAIVGYWCLFNTHAIKRAVVDHQHCVFDFGGGPIVFENAQQRERIRQVLAPFDNVIRLLPSPDLAKSVAILQERGSHLVGANAQGFDWSSFFVHHEANQQLAKYHIYTDGKTPDQACAEILTLVNRT